jgi:RNA polymerase sigma factor (sigma-70 family)
MGLAHDEDDDIELLAGCAEEFGRFYLRHEDAILTFFLRRTRSAELAADLAAETFARALEGRRGFDVARGSPRGWLFGIAKHLLSDSLAGGRVQDAARRRLGLERLAVDDDALARIDELTGGEALEALEGLTVEQRTAVEGRVFDEQSYEELAVRLRCSKSVVRQRVSRGLRVLRDRLEGLA